ncbi:D-amino acid dehydrogenase small subunit [Gluconobacter thailandicus F149-1 = NBRC 100600]|uniref:D-amino acid dehydrogenase n=2 Tax=Gluconobacter thailandicus TaxID=257438 RepID=A0AAP9JHE7_GLUTH|nr:D-amino acid dehydrogenase [Gluconobacter thailandicus]GAN90477.1 D-amino acid dehydrogenase small subunit [Gluconobacter frateurii M-2]KXV54008.1 amino acid dehydrogenase [Gluconobacter thailandicus]QEH96108.1 D-amino acid dehydrogenase [Gluconobacter thailandicus]GAC88251.1 D-amino acid dehydrogenase small subunit [Gluconobacter thailandicus NBRC 3255]GAD25849.1 D-amino acid dehydrogenase small subunit [Gluconobacter thailandicus NBRC 3257]
MKIIVMGAGVIGVTTAWYLAQEGHEVEVIDRQPGVGLETSFANAGQVSPGYSTPWAMPGLPFKVAKWMTSKHSPLVVRPRFDTAMFRFMGELLANCSEKAYDINKSRMLRIAEYARDKIDALRDETGITYDGDQKGLIQLFRTDAQVEHAAEDMRLLAESGVDHQLLNVDEIIAHEPGLAHARHRLRGGLRLPGDQTGDAHLFTRRLAAMAEQKGVKFRLGTNIEAIEATSDSILSIRTSAGRLKADAYVLALGSYSPRLMKPLELRLPIYPVKGYSLTMPITDESRAPVSTVNDETYKVAITRLGDRIRIGGTAELTGFSLRLSPDRRETLELSFNEMYGGGDLSAARYWTGLRPCTPDGTPIVGPSPRYENLWLNTGHGTLGWTMAAGSGQIVADQISGRQTAIPSLDLSLDRYL